MGRTGTADQSELRPYYWPPPWGVPVVLRSPRGYAAPSWAPLNRACRCWAESGCLLALLLTDDTKGRETGVGLEHSGNKVTQPHEELKKFIPLLRQTWSYRLISNLPEKKVLDKYLLPFTWPWCLTHTYQTGLKLTSHCLEGLLNYGDKIRWLQIQIDLAQTQAHYHNSTFLQP